MNNTRLITAESVRRGHPDKFCDQVADLILDAHLAGDPGARVAVEVFATAGKVIVAGEVTSSAQVNYRKIVWELIGEIGYIKGDTCLDPLGHLDIDVLIHEQSSDIACAVDGMDQLGAGDQGIMVGYATDETPEFLPLPIVLAHMVCRRLDNLAREVHWLGADGKAQVTVSYEDEAAKEITAIIISVQHTEDADLDCLRERIRTDVVETVIPTHLITENTLMLINPSGKFVLGGPVADTGLTGRKLAVDQYGLAARFAGGALSGKDPTKVDRSGAYAARWIAKCIVAAGLARRCEVQIAYAIGRAVPVGVSVDTFQTGTVSDTALALAVQRTFDLRPASIIDQLHLRAPIYSPLAVYGHYGRDDLSFVSPVSLLCTSIVAGELMPRIPSRKYYTRRMALPNGAARFPRTSRCPFATAMWSGRTIPPTRTAISSMPTARISLALSIVGVYQLPTRWRFTQGAISGRP